MSSAKVWFVTGASSGFGLHVTECALRHGDKVVATLRRPPMLAELAAQYPSSQLLVLKMDVTEAEDVSKAFADAKAHFGRIDVVFNNAGLGHMGELEGTPEEFARAVLEVNFWGAVKVTKEAVRFFREENNPQGGLLLQNSSMMGLIASQCTPFYVAAKWALEGATQSLSMELDPAWNIKLILVEPGWFRTGIASAALRAPVHPAYKESPGVVKFREWAATNPLEPGDPAKAAEAILKIADLPDPPLRFPLGRDCIASVKNRDDKLRDVIEEYGHWSDGLDVEAR
ncbi:hypothetical protein IEO21_09166 [Rhodonia placenta]|uniref:NAD(P)-binding protein n=2 Tax=Rhodonia placenta TaxID=104341 RepID=A0A8H7TY07_9APHY|nr:hypothetical protein IEO21_09166 [Postia placenta]